MKDSLDEIFSEENMKAYSKSCLELASEMPDFYQSNMSFDTLIIPSRGAVPFFLGMVYALEKVHKDFGGVHTDFFNSLGVQSLISPLLPKDLGISPDPHGKQIRVLLIPSTADLNVEKFDPTLNNTEYTRLTREYWANVTAAFFQNPNKRVRDPYFRSFVDVILKNVEKRLEVASLYESFPRISRSAIIDTVISGRASNEILRKFDSLAVENRNRDLMPAAFLIVDKDGTILE